MSRPIRLSRLVVASQFSPDRNICLEEDWLYEFDALIAGGRLLARQTWHTGRTQVGSCAELQGHMISLTVQGSTVLAEANLRRVASEAVSGSYRHMTRWVRGTV